LYTCRVEAVCEMYLSVSAPHRVSIPCTQRPTEEERKTDLSDGTTSNGLLAKLLKDLVERLPEDLFDDALGVLERVRLPVRVEFPKRLAQSFRKEVRSRACPLSELHIAMHSCQLESAFG
jgi:hypothetical protein